MKQALRNQTGFTIVELLIVIVVIAILAAITVVAYNGIQNRAYDSAVQSDITAFAKKVEALKVDSTTGAVPFPLTSTAGIRVTKNAYEVRNNLYYCTNGGQFAVGAISKSGKGYSYDTTNGQRTFTNGSANISGADVCAMVGQPAWNTTYGQFALDGPTAVWANWVQ